MIHHSWLYCILVGIGFTVSGLAGFAGYIWLNSKVYNVIDRKFSDDMAILIILGGNLIFWCSLLISLACRGVIR